MIALHSGVSAASYTTEAPLAPPVPRMLDTINYDYDFVSSSSGLIYECENNKCLLNDKSWPNKIAASNACDEIPDCGFITCKTVNQYVLRRWSENKTKQCSTCLTFSKPQNLRGAQKLTPDKIVETLPYVHEEYQVSFDVLVKEISKITTWQNMLHLTIGENLKVPGDRIPGLWLNKNGRLHIASAVNGKTNYFYDTKSAFPLNKWVNIVIEQKKTHGIYLYTIQIDGEELHSVENKKGVRRYENVKVYAADPWYASANGYIRNLKITTNPGAFTEVLRRYDVHCDGRGCLDSNRQHVTRKAAEARCEELAECGLVAEWWHDAFYLRRIDDPVRTVDRDVVTYAKVGGTFTANRKGRSVGCWGTCINGNKPYEIKEVAVGKCLITPGCDSVMRWQDGKFYLRKLEGSSHPNPKTEVFMLPKTDKACPKKLPNGEKCKNHCDCERGCTPTKLCHC